MVGALLVAQAQGCAASGTLPGMVEASPRLHDREPSLVELARAAPPSDHRVLLVVYPRTACSASASTIFMDRAGTFIGAVAPGTAALLSVPKRLRTLVAVSSVEVSAPLHTWSSIEETPVPPAPAALVLRARQWSARECASGQYTQIAVATKDEVERTLADEDIRWLEARPRAGQAWLDAHRERVAEVLARRTPPPPPAQLGWDGVLYGRGGY